MANCKDCIHYGICTFHITGNENEKCTHYTPTADVVPKSEVEEIIGKFECLLCHVTGSRLSKHTYDLRTMETVATDCINETYNDGFGEGYKECAREIFEELEFDIHQLMFERDETRAIAIEGIIAELKKKYTEEQSGDF